jgi:hypothetical protein
MGRRTFSRIGRAIANALASHSCKLVVALLLVASVPAVAAADDDNGESVPLVVRKCTNDTPSIVDDTRCTKTDCPADCSLDAVYFGARMECAFGLDAREPFLWTGSGFEATDWETCATADCYWGNASTCAASCATPGACPACLPESCSGGGCPASGVCGGTSTACFDPDHHRIRWRHPVETSMISSPTIATCTANGASYPDDGVHERIANHCIFIGAQERYLLAIDEEPALPPWVGGAPDPAEPSYGSCLWSYKVDAAIWRNPVAPAPECDPDQDDCWIFAASKDGYLGRFDRYPKPVATPPACTASDSSQLDCPMRVRDWEIRLRDDGSVAAQGGMLLVHEDDGDEAWVTPPGEDPTRVLMVGTSRGYRAVKVDVPDAGSGGPARGVHNDEYDAWLRIDEVLGLNNKEEKLERYSVQGPSVNGAFRFYSGFGASGGAPSGLAAVSLDVARTDGKEPLQLDWVFRRGLPTEAGFPTPVPSPAVNGCEDRSGPTGGVETDEVQYHRTNPALSGDGNHVFITNRHATSRDLSGTLIALRTQTTSHSSSNPYYSSSSPNDGASTIAHPHLVACVVPSQGDGIVAPPAAAWLSCDDVPTGAAAPCCANNDAFDRIVVISKQPAYHVYDFCDATGGSNPKFHLVGEDDQWLRSPGNLESFAELRVQPAIAADAGTFYFYDNNPAGERFFAYDLFDPTRLKWFYDASPDGPHDNGTVCKLGVPAGGRDCYLAPIPYLDGGATSVSGGIDLSVKAYRPTDALVGGLGRTAAATEDKIWGPFTAGTVNDLYEARWYNDTNGESGDQPVTCPSNACTLQLREASGDLEPGVDNDIIVTVRNKFGKQGSTLLRIPY